MKDEGEGKKGWIEERKERKEEESEGREAEAASSEEG